MFRFCTTLIAIALAIATTRSVSAEVAAFDDFGLWQAAAGEFTTITFTEFTPDLVTDQYAELGVLFTDGNDLNIPSPTGFPLDGWGLDGGPDDKITLEFSQSQYSLAMHYPGGVVVQLYLDDVSLGEPLDSPTSGFNNFFGIVSEVGFNRAVIYDPDILVAIDNLYFGPPIPAPAGLALLALAGIRLRRRHG